MIAIKNQMYKPKFIFTKVYIQTLVIFTAPFLFFAFFTASVLDDSFGFSNVAYSEYFWFYGLVSFLIIAYIYTIIVRFNYVATRYELKVDGLIYAEGFLNTVNKEIKWRRVVEISLKRSLWQRVFDLGTVVVSTAATGDQTAGHMTSTGIHLTDLENYDDAYTIIKTAFEKTN